MRIPSDAYRESLEAGKLDALLADFYGHDLVPRNRERLAGLASAFESDFGHRDILALSAPGRTELGGNHTDHNHGRVLAAAVHLDCRAVAAPSRDSKVAVHSEGHAPIEFDASDTAPRRTEEGKAVALVRGVLHALREAGYRIGGFSARTHGTIPTGTGLSSSAAFSVLMGRICNHFFNDRRIPPLEIARAARLAENVHFGKPCGFMDQIACSFMGASAVDFLDPDNPVVTPVPWDFEQHKYRLAVVNTGGSHSDLTPDYAAIHDEMVAGARVLGKKYARELTLEQVLAELGRIRAEAGERAALRLLHFLEEDERAALQAEAVRHHDMDKFIRLVAQSGLSSSLLLQNCFTTSRPKEQPIPLALAATQRFLGGLGACRVHGGGFAGTIQAFVPAPRFDAWREYMDSIFGRGATIPLELRRPGLELLMPEANGAKEKA